MSYINRPVNWSAQNGTVIDEASGKRGKTLLTIKLEDGRVVKVDLRSVSFRDEEIFTQPTGTVTFTARDRDYYGDRARMFARSRF